MAGFTAGEVVAVGLPTGDPDAETVMVAAEVVEELPDGRLRVRLPNGEVGRVAAASVRREP